MESIQIEEWGGHRFYFDPDEVKKAQWDDEVLFAIRDYKGNQIYSIMRCRRLAKTPEGKSIAKKMREICEGGKNKKRDREARGKAQKNQDR